MPGPAAMVDRPMMEQPTAAPEFRFFVMYGDEPVFHCFADSGEDAVRQWLAQVNDVDALPIFATVLVYQGDGGTMHTLRFVSD